MFVQGQIVRDKSTHQLGRVIGIQLGYDPFTRQLCKMLHVRFEDCERLVRAQSVTVLQSVPEVA